MTAQTPDQLHSLFIEAFNHGDLDAMLALYEPTACLVPRPRLVTHGRDANRQALQQFLALKGRMAMTTSFAIPNGDLALLRGQWSLTGTGPDGKRIEMGGNSIEVARQQPNDDWLFVIDHPFGAAAEAPNPLCQTQYNTMPLPPTRTGVTTLEDLHPLFVDAFNAADLEALLSLYEPQAAMIPKPHQLVHGHDGIRRALQQLLSLKATFILTTSFVIQAGDIALLRGKWQLHGSSPHGQVVTTSGNDVEVARLQADDTWRFVIDHAYGANE